MTKWLLMTIAVLLGIIALLLWRPADVSTAKTDVTAPIGQALVIQEVDQAQVKDLLHKRGCVNCHDMTNTLVGPSFEALALHYQQQDDAETRFLQRFREGSQGQWGTNQMMPPQSTQAVSDTEASAMYAWIVALKP
nr:cytochrome c551/c552 [uncultured bacterium]